MIYNIINHFKVTHWQSPHMHAYYSSVELFSFLVRRHVGWCDWLSWIHLGTHALKLQLIIIQCSSFEYDLYSFIYLSISALDQLAKFQSNYVHERHGQIETQTWESFLPAQLTWLDPKMTRNRTMKSTCFFCLGFIFDSDMSFSDQIKSVSKSCHFHIRDIRRIRHLLPLSTATALANSLVSSKLDYCNSLYSGIYKQISTNFNAFKIHWHVSLQTLQNINTSHQHSKGLHWLGWSNKELIVKICLLTYKRMLTNQQPTYLITIVFHFRHILFLHDLLIHLYLSIPYCPIITWKKGFLCHRSTTLEFTPSWYPKLVFSTNIPFQAQNPPLQNCFPSLGSFPSPWTVYPDFDSCYSHFMPYRMTPSVRHQAIEVHYYLLLLLLLTVKWLYSTW